MRTHLLVSAVVMSACLLPGCGGSTGPATMEYVELIPAQPKIGDVATVRFKLLDSRGIPLAGQNVDFKLGSANTGVILSPVSAVSIKGSGFAETQIIANSRVNSVVVIATAGDKVVTSPPLTFAGSVANGRQFTFQCGGIAGDGSGGRHAIGAFDSSRHLIAGSAIDCTAHIGDRNGDGVNDALVSFMTEAGTIGATGISKTDLVGNAVVLYKTSLPLPLDVKPVQWTWQTLGDDPNNTGEYLAPLWMHPFNWVENPRDVFSSPTTRYTMQEPRRPDPIRLKPDGVRFENNPRDNLVSMIAVTSGEEGFTDTNNNGQHDPEEGVFDDLTEPFVDSNDDGTWQNDERFIDVNGNGTWDGKNGKWDANTLIWRQERLLWTGYPADEDILPSVSGVANHRAVFSPAGPNPIALTCPGTGSQCTQAGPPVLVTAYLADPWFNSIAQNGDSDTCSIDTEDKSPVVAAAESGDGFAYTYPAGRYMRFLVKDARDPNAPPINQIDRRSPPITFVATIECKYTSAPKESYELKIGVGSVTGTIE